ncbi:MAG: hypothetical protein ACI4NM_04475 [Bullifex sp.]
MIFQLSDLFTLFSIRFVSGGDGLDESFWTKGMNSGSRNAWKGYAFEQVCLHHIKEIKARLGISGVLSSVHSWHQPAFTDADGTEWQGGQIDLIIDRKDDCINLCEINYCNEEYVITSEYETRLRERTALFRHATKTRKALHLTFITTSGVKRNTHYGVIQSEVKLDDLFREVYF